MNKVAPVVYSLDFHGFALNFEVDVAQSIEETRAFSSAPPEFVFVAGEIVVRTATSRHVVVDRFNAGNLLELIRSMRERIASLPSCAAIPTLVSAGKVCAWMRGYWRKIENDEVRDEDELNYDLLTPLTFIEGRDGRICLYRHDGKSIIEASRSAYPHLSEPEVELASAFDPRHLGIELSRVAQEAHAAVRRALN